jgi:hypothetical protein
LASNCLSAASCFVGGCHGVKKDRRLLGCKSSTRTARIRWCYRGDSSWTTAQSWTSFFRTLASSTCTSKISVPHTCATASRSRWTRRSSGRVSSREASHFGSQVEQTAASGERSLPGGDGRPPGRRPAQLLQSRAVDQGRPARRAASVRRQQPGQGLRAVHQLRQEAAARAPDHPAEEPGAGGAAPRAGPEAWCETPNDCAAPSARRFRSPHTPRCNLFSEERALVMSSVADRAATPVPRHHCRPARSLVEATPTPNPRHA